MTAGPGTLELTKHHGAGNDFLVLVDRDGTRPITAELTRTLCDRHTGIGADGLIRVTPDRGADLVMELRNADGRTAEMSGNGMRALAQAAVDAGLVVPPTFTVSTEAGVRTVTFTPGERPGEARASVEMGRVDLGAELDPPVPNSRVRLVSTGNPHLVRLAPTDPATLPLVEIGEAAQEAHPPGINVECIAVGPVDGELVLRVYERGVGETLACGTGSVAAAAAARAWGLVGDTVAVHNPGGTLEVRLGEREDDPAVLSGPVRRVATVLIDAAALPLAVTS